MTAFTVVVVTHNSAAVIRDCLASIRGSMPAGAEIIVVDNGSSDQTVASVAGAIPRQQILECGDNRGFGYGCNRGASRGSGEWIVFLNPDCVLRSFDQNAWDVAISRPGVGAVGFRTIDGSGDDSRMRVLRNEPPLLCPALQYSWGVTLPKHFHTRLSAFHVKDRCAPSRRAQQRKAWLSGAALAVNRVAWEQVGGFDEGFFLYSEDIDLCTRLRKAGWMLIGSSCIEVSHSSGQSFGDPSSVRRLAFGVAGWLTYVNKWRGRRTAGAAYRFFRMNCQAARAALLVACIFRPRLRARALAKRRDLEDLLTLLSGSRSPASGAPGVDLAGLVRLALGAEQPR